jgi:hypothetical protein
MKDGVRRLLRYWLSGSAAMALLAGCAIEPQDHRSSARPRNPLAWSAAPLASAARVWSYDGDVAGLLDLLERASFAGECYVAALAWERLRPKLAAEPRLAFHWQERLARSAPRDGLEPVSIPAAPNR